jgi:hypothetical protein
MSGRLRGAGLPLSLPSVGVRADLEQHGFCDTLVSHPNDPAQQPGRLGSHSTLKNRERPDLLEHLVRQRRHADYSGAT